jgi:hypothetical protein
MTAIDLDRIDPAKLKIGSPDWLALTARRSDLIRRDVYEGLTPIERSELTRLEALIGAKVDQAHPVPPADDERLDRIEGRPRHEDRAKAS